MFYTEPVVATGQPLAPLVEAMRNGAVSALLMLDVNPVYDAPGSLDFLSGLQNVKLRIHAGAYVDETALHSDWHAPLQQTLESWADARAADGTVTLAQPTIAPLYEGRTAGEILSLLGDDEPRASRDLLREHYQAGADDAAFAPRWSAMLQQGFVPDTALPPVHATPDATAAPAQADTPAGLMVVIRPDPTIWGGKTANNAWLQELPKPLTKLVWENVLTLAPALAARAGLASGDIATLQVNGRSVEGAVWVLPGQADRMVGVTLGYGRQVPELLCDGLGYNAAALRGGGDPWVLTGAVLAKTGRRAALATTQDHDTMEGHAFIRVQAEGAAPVGETTSWSQPSLYGEKPPQEGPQWGMVIDLDACIGCNACVVACQSENNIAVVGKEQVALGREMHWLRVDRYYEGPADAPQTRFQPVPCMHCENAPCEVGCPVEATLHDSEGLNLMVYNRCVGTRACSGYCPYKVRHFNYLDYSAGAAPTIELMRNPEVTVRARGVMEKCTYCVQRIENARIEAHKADAPIADGAVQTACQGACPTRAISFGNLHDSCERGQPGAGGRPQLCAAGRTERQAADDLPGRARRQARPGDSRVSELAQPRRTRQHDPGGPELGRRRPRRDRGRAGPPSPLALVDRVRGRDRPDRRAGGERVLAALRGRRRLGQQHPGHLGVGHRGLRLVDRGRDGELGRLGAAASARRGMARHGEPAGRDGGAAGGVRRRAVSDYPSWPAVVLLLEFALSRILSCCGRSSAVRCIGMRSTSSRFWASRSCSGSPG